MVDMKGKVLAKYDIRGIQSYIFRSNKLKEIRAVSDLPEKIIFTAAEELMKEPEYRNTVEFIDRKGGNAVAVISSKEEFEKFSRCMAEYILRNTYSLRLVYAAVDCTDNFPADYAELNRKIGILKSEMPEACHTGAFPVCRQDYITGFPFSQVEPDKYRPGMKKYLTKESELKLSIIKGNSGNNSEENKTDNYILEKGEDSHIALIHIDGNSIGQKINEIIKRASYDNIKTVFDSISVSSCFRDVCSELITMTEKYAETQENKYLIHSVICAGDDITLITRANIALPFTKLFLKKISEKFMFKDEEDSYNEDYRITACAGISFINSHFPFYDAYRLAEKCCAEAKKRAALYGGNWVDFEICTHVKDTDISSKRRKYGMTTDEEGNRALLYMRPFFVDTQKLNRNNEEFIQNENSVQEFFSFEKFEKRIRILNSENSEEKRSFNRSRSKALRQAYSDGGVAVSNFRSIAESRGYPKTEYYAVCPGDENTYALYYDAVDIMDLYDKSFEKWIKDNQKEGSQG